MVGCIIGRAGSKISEIRKTSGARISIAKAPHDDTGERMFTIMGSAKANETALYLLYENLEERRCVAAKAPLRTNITLILARCFPSMRASFIYPDLTCREADFAMDLDA